MKKFVIGLCILVIFAGYSLVLRHQQPIIRKPESLVSSTVASSTTQQGSSTSSSGSSGSSTASTGSSTTAAQYKDGSYTGSVADAYYGNVQVSVTIVAGKISSVKFLQYPNTHSTSIFINQQAMPFLQQEAIKAQSANVQLISGATFTSQAFIQSLTAALTQA